MGDEERVDLLLHGFLSRFFAIPARQPASGPITFAQMRVLWSLDRKDTSTPGEIAGVLGVCSSTATGLIGRLERGGYLQRVHSDQDRRQVWLRLRPRGRHLMAEFRRYHQSRLHRLLSRLDAGEVRRMAGALETLNRLVARWEGAK